MILIYSPFNCLNFKIIPESQSYFPLLLHEKVLGDEVNSVTRYASGWLSDSPPCVGMGRVGVTE